MQLCYEWININLDDSLYLSVETNLIDVDIDKEANEDDIDARFSKQKRKLTRRYRLCLKSSVKLKTKEKKKRCKCNHYGSIYFCGSNYGTGNLRRYIMVMLQEIHAMSIGSSKIDL